MSGTPAPRPDWHRRALLGSVLAAAAGYLGFALWTGWADVASAIARVGVIGLMLALMLSLVNYSLRFVRWQLYLRTTGHAVPWRASLRIYVAGFALTTTPGKAGEAVRGVLLKPLGVPYPASFAAFLSERLSDLFAIVTLTLLGLAAYPSLRPLVLLGAAALLAALLLLASAHALQALRGRFRGDARPARLARHAIDALLQARHCHAPQVLVPASALSLAGWAAEAWAFHLILQWMGVEVGMAFAVFVFAVAMLAGALSFLPGGLGGTEAVMVTLLLSAGVGAADAVAATVLIRLATLWFAVALGLLAAGPALRRPT